MSLETLKTKVGLLIEKAQSGGGTPEVVTFTTSTNNAVTTTDAFKLLVDNEKDIVAFRFIGDKSTWVQNQCVYTVVTKANAVGLLRYRDNKLQECVIGMAYDAVVNVGDKYEKMKVGEL